MANVPINNITDTWNSSGTTFTGIKFNVTDTASASASLLMDLQVGGNSAANISKLGTLALQNRVGAGSYQVGIGPYGYIAMALYYNGLSAPSALVRDAGFLLRSGAAYGWGSHATYPETSPDLLLYRDGVSGTLAQRNGANGQTFRLYGNYLTGSDFRRLKMAMSLAGVAEIKPEDGGTYAGSTVLYISGLPTSNPGPGILWNNGGVVNVGT